MPRVITATAAKDYPDHGIAKGDTYYHWTFFRGRKQMSKTMPRRSQTTGSSKLANVYAAEENLQDMLNGALTPADVVEALEQAISDADSCVDEYNESVSNLEDGFPNGCPALDDTQAALEAIEAWRDELESAKDDVEGLEASDYVDAPEEGGTPRAEVEGWDDLTDNEQGCMLSDAQDMVNGISLDL